RGLSLAPVIKALVRWGLPSLTLPAPASGSAPDREVFDQRWAIPDPTLVADETYEWTVDGVQFALEVSGRSVTRTRGPARDPAVRLITTRAAFDSVLAGGRTPPDVTAAGDVQLTGSPAAIERMFTAIGFPTHMLLRIRPDRRP